jgi:hypothetical protein
MRPLLVALAALLLWQPARAQTRFTYSKGQTVAPSYEGWTPNEDGSFTLYFGYMNANWLEEFDVPIGPDNAIEPGGPDRGQPTHFYPRRNPFLFTIRVPREFGEKELTWTLTTNGVTERAYASLKTDYQINNQVISLEVGGDLGSTRDELRDNIPPSLEVQGAKQRSVKVGEPLTLVAIAGDPDNLPPRRDGKPQPGLLVKPAGGKIYKPNTRAQTGDANLAETVYRSAALVDRLPGQGWGGDLHPRPAEDVDRLARLRELAVVTAVQHSRAAAGREVGDASHTPGARHLRPPRRRQRRIAVHVRERDHRRDALTFAATVSIASYAYHFLR